MGRLPWEGCQQAQSPVPLEGCQSRREMVSGERLEESEGGRKGEFIMSRKERGEEVEEGRAYVADKGLRMSRKEGRTAEGSSWESLGWRWRLRCVCWGRLDEGGPAANDDDDGSSGSASCCWSLIVPSFCGGRGRHLAWMV